MSVMSAYLWVVIVRKAFDFLVDVIDTYQSKGIPEEMKADIVALRDKWVPDSRIELAKTEYANSNKSEIGAVKITTLIGGLAGASWIYTLYPLLLDVYDKGRIVYDVCFAPVSALCLAISALLTTLYTYLKPSPAQAKLIKELQK